MYEFIRENFKHLMDNSGDRVALAGIVLVLLGGAVFLGATPRGMKPNAAGDAWLLAAPMIAAGLSLFGLNWYWNR
jgi:hypothetical protein